MLETMVEKWRFITLEKRDGFFNTALDEALIESVSEGESPPTIVVTEWEPTVSLGNSQKYSLDVNGRACERLGVKVTRRRSGGQSVFLNDGYIVFSVVATNKYLGGLIKLDSLRKRFSETLASGLRDMGVSAEFHKPDNVIITNGDIRKTIGNSGQKVTSGEDRASSIHGSVRYELTSFDDMLEVLKINGNDLQNYREEIRKVLGSIRDYSGITKEGAVSVLSKRFLEEYSGNNFVEGKLTLSEEARIKNLVESYYGNWEQVKDKEIYRTRGVCYLYINGEPVIDSVGKLLGYNEPSKLEV